MTERISCSVGSIAYELGELRDIGEIEELRNEPEVLTALRTGGLEHYSVTLRSPLEQAELCLRKTLAQHAAGSGPIEALIYASESPWSERLYVQLNQMLVRLGLQDAYPIGLSLSGCTNFSMAIRIAASLIHAEGLHNVLIVCSDKAPEGGRRTLRPGVCVYSDGAVSCVVGREGKGEFDVLQIGHENSPEMGDFNLERDAASLVMGIIEGVRKAVGRALLPIGGEPSRIRRLLLGNFAKHIATMYASLSGFSNAQCYFDNIPRFSHTYAGDPLINLCDSHRNDPLERGDLCMLLGIAVTSWGVLVLRKT
jgi:3-oxoacyl-[acyl-carrier-protein] synthase III